MTDKNIVTKVLDAEINDLMQLVIKQKESVKTAKTSAKKQYLSKKIKRNTDLLIGYLASAQKLRNLKEKPAEIIS